MADQPSADELRRAREALAALPRVDGLTFKGVPIEELSRSELVMLLGYLYGIIGKERAANATKGG